MRAALLLVLAACVDHGAAITGTASLKVELVAPADPGSIDARLPDAARAVSLKISAIDENGNPDPTYGNTLQVYVSFLGTLSPYLGGSPLPEALRGRELEKRRRKSLEEFVFSGAWGIPSPVIESNGNK